MPDASGLLIAHAQQAWGSAACPPQAADAVDGIAPSVVLRPSTTAMLAEMLRWADRDRLVLVPRGSGTKIGWGPRIRRLDAIVSLAHLPHQIEHAAGDLVGIFPAGATLSAVNATLARDQQWLPLDPLSGDNSTIGGLIATNESGPRRVRHGAPRDLVIGVEMVLADGTLAKSGGRVVKNVSGYDLARMLCGSCGTLAVVTSATFKLSPRPVAACTVAASVSEIAALAELALGVAALPVSASAIDFDGPPWRLLIRIESTPTVTAAHAEHVARFLSARAASLQQVSGPDDDALWRASAETIRSTPGTLLKVSVPATSLGPVLVACEQAARQQGVAVRTTGRATLGVCFVRLLDGGEDPTRVSSIVEAVRTRATDAGGFALLLEAPVAVKDRVPAYATAGSTGPLMQAVKKAFDPRGILNPDRSFA